MMLTKDAEDAETAKAKQGIIELSRTMGLYACGQSAGDWERRLTSNTDHLFLLLRTLSKLYNWAGADPADNAGKPPTGRFEHP